MIDPADRFELPALPFERHSLEPEISRAQVDILFSHHHRRQLAILNTKLAPNDPRSLASLANDGDERLRHHAAEAWNMTLFWHSLTPRTIEMPEALRWQIERDLGSIQALRDAWRTRVQSRKGGWSWLVASDPDRGIQLMETAAGRSTPPGITPLLVVPLVAEAYRIDHGDDCSAYFDAVWPHLNWETAQLNRQVGSQA